MGKKAPSKYIKPNLITYNGKKKVPYKHGMRLTLRMDKLDTRTKIGKTANFLYEVLWDYLGPNAEAPALLLVDTIVFKRMQMLFLENQNTEKPMRDLPQVYLSLSNALRRDLETLSKFVDRGNLPDLDKYLQENYGK